MIITDVTSQRRDTERFNIFIDGEFSFSASREDVVKYSIILGREVSGEEVESLIEKCEYAKAYNYSLNLLNNRNYTELQLQKKLLDKGFSDITINLVLENLRIYGIINDERYARSFMNDSLSLKKNGINKIIHNLQSKGIDRNILDQLEYDSEIEFENCMELAVKKYRTIEGRDNAKEKMYRFLAYRGYKYDTIIKVLNIIFKNCESGEL